MRRSSKLLQLNVKYKELVKVLDKKREVIWMSKKYCIMCDLLSILRQMTHFTLLFVIFRDIFLTCYSLKISSVLWDTLMQCYSP